MRWGHAEPPGYSAQSFSLSLSLFLDTPSTGPLKRVWIGLFPPQELMVLGHKLPVPTSDAPSEHCGSCSGWCSQAAPRTEVSVSCPDPVDWSPGNVQKWLLWTEHQYRLPPVGKAFQELGGKELCAMSEEQFRQRSPLGGDVLHAHLDIWKSGGTWCGWEPGTQRGLLGQDAGWALLSDGLCSDSQPLLRLCPWNLGELTSPDPFQPWPNT